jgi:hypothetical protein
MPWQQKNKIILLITKGEKVVAQFPIPQEFVLAKNNPIKEIRKTNLFQYPLTKDGRTAFFSDRRLTGRNEKS